MILQLFLLFPRPVFLLWLSSSGATNKDAACSAERSSPLGPSMLQSASNSCLCFAGGTERQAEWGGCLRAGYDPSARVEHRLVSPLSASPSSRSDWSERVGDCWLKPAEQTSPVNLMHGASQGGVGALIKRANSFWVVMFIRASIVCVTSNFSAASQLNFSEETWWWFAPLDWVLPPSRGQTGAVLGLNHSVPLSENNLRF